MHQPWRLPVPRGTLPPPPEVRAPSPPALSNGTNQRIDTLFCPLSSGDAVQDWRNRCAARRDPSGLGIFHVEVQFPHSGDTWLIDWKQQGRFIKRTCSRLGWICVGVPVTAEQYVRAYDAFRRSCTLTFDKCGFLCVPFCAETCAGDAGTTICCRRIAEVYRDVGIFPDDINVYTMTPGILYADLKCIRGAHEKAPDPVVERSARAARRHGAALGLSMISSQAPPRGGRTRQYNARRM